MLKCVRFVLIVLLVCGWNYWIMYFYSRINVWRYRRRSFSWRTESLEEKSSIRIYCKTFIKSWWHEESFQLGMCNSWQERNYMGRRFVQGKFSFHIYLGKYWFSRNFYPVLIILSNFFITTNKYFVISWLWIKLWTLLGNIKFSSYPDSPYFSFHSNFSWLILVL